MDDSEAPLLPAWLAFTLAFDASARLVQYLRQANPDPAATGRLIRQYQQGDTLPLCIAMRGKLDTAQLYSLTAPPIEQRINAALEWQDASPDHHLIGLDDPGYPALLLDTVDAPPLLYAKGDLKSLQCSALAIVGSRKASRQSIDLTRKLASGMAERNVAIVSGLARGIDAAAHEGALSVGGRTIAVAATEPESVYPKCHTGLAQRIIDHGGLILTEYPLAAPTLRWYFPRRNRIISGISLGVLVAEAGLPSGTLTTATHAINQGREVMAIPGSVMNPQARGCHALIKQGATLVENEQDILDALAWPLLRKIESEEASKPRERTYQGDTKADTWSAIQPESRVLKALAVAPSTIDDLMTQIDCSVAELTTLLGLLEIDGKIRAGAGGRYTRC
ncbi:MAG: DNA-processing protein DprA [Granulosicoccus sp.]